MSVNYPYQGGYDIEKKRLKILASLYDDNSFKQIRKYLKKGFRVLELGFGTGQILQKIAAEIGETGHCIGIDNAKHQVELAKQKTKDRGLTNLEYHEHDVLQKLPELIAQYQTSIDVIYFRWFLWIFPKKQQQQIINTCSLLLKPRGILIAEESDMTTLSCTPKKPALEEYHRLTLERSKKNGHPTDLGRQIADGMLTINGLTILEGTEYQPVAKTAMEKSLLFYSLLSTKEALKGIGVSEEKYSQLLLGLQTLAKDNSIKINSTTNICTVMQKL